MSNKQAPWKASGKDEVGDHEPTGQSVLIPERYKGVLELVAEKSGWAKRPKEPGRGMGIAAFYHGSGFTGSGEVYLNSLGGIDVMPDGKVRVLVSNTEFGQGTNTILTQIAAEALGIDYADVTMAAPDTGVVPNSGPTVASRTSMVIGRIIERACSQLLELLREHAGLGATYTPAEFFAACERSALVC